MHWIVSKEEEGISLQAFLLARADSITSLKGAKRVVDAKLCTVNDQLQLLSFRPLKKGDQVHLFVEEPKVCSILYEDEDLVLCNKPSSIVSDSQELHALLPSRLSRTQLVHRLDKETSGVLLLSKNRDAHEKLLSLFAKRRVEKRYLAILHGNMSKKEGKICAPIGCKSRRVGESLFAVMPNGQSATTFWRVLQASAVASFVLCAPITGRTHQIRVHLLSLGHPLLGDTLYARDRHNPVLCRRQMLHAYRLSFPHPRTGETVEVLAPIPLDFKLVLRSLGLVKETCSDFGVSAFKKV